MSAKKEVYVAGHKSFWRLLNFKGQIEATQRLEYQKIMTNVIKIWIIKIMGFTFYIPVNVFVYTSTCWFYILKNQ